MSQTVLLVEDDEILGQVLGRVLARQGYTVHHATSAGQGLELAREQRPQLALLDLCLPDGDGVELARQLRAQLPDLPLVLITAYPVRLCEQPLEAGLFTRVLTKPLSLPELRQTIAMALAPCGLQPANARPSLAPTPSDPSSW